MEAQDKPFISIVVPAYNVEHYLDKCMQSIFEQTRADFEVILVDDGSTDSTPQLCDAWGEKDERITVVHTKNCGNSSARNQGFKRAGGKLIWFVDSDDYIARNAVERIEDAMHCESHDLVAINFRPFDEEGELPLDDLGFTEIPIEGTQNVSKLESLLYLGQRGHFTFSYVYDAERLRTFADDAGPFDASIELYEDAALIHRYLGDIDTVAFIAEPLYWYRQTPGSALHQSNAKKAASGLRSVEIISRLTIPPELEDARRQMLIRFILSIDTLAGDSEEGTVVRKQARDLLEKMLKQPPKASLPIGYRVKCALVRAGLYQPLRKMLIRLGIIKAWNVK